eukprot:7102120-Prymnesium_polylepis.1
MGSPQSVTRRTYDFGACARAVVCNLTGTYPRTMRCIPWYGPRVCETGGTGALGVRCLYLKG